MNLEESVCPWCDTVLTVEELSPREQAVSCPECSFAVDGIPNDGLAPSERTVVDRVRGYVEVKLDADVSSVTHLTDAEVGPGVDSVFEVEAGDRTVWAVVGYSPWGMYEPDRFESPLAAAIANATAERE